MDPEDVRAFARRSWGMAADLDAEHWARQFRQRGPAATLAISCALWEHMRRVRPDWPSAAERQSDLDHHLRFKRALDRVAGAFAGLAPR